MEVSKSWVILNQLVQEQATVCIHAWPFCQPDAA